MVPSRIGDTATLQNGVGMPWLGLGVYRTDEGREVENAVSHAIELGYRLIDTAKMYGNEVGVGSAIRASGVPREDLFVTTKVWNSDQGYDSTLRAFDASLERLGLGYLDLYLVHWPVRGRYKDTWKAFERLYRDGRTRAIGVCNFQVHHLDDLLQDAEVTPMVNQVECHPLLSQEPLRSHCLRLGIQMQAWSPLMRGHLEHPWLADLAGKYGRTPAQIVLRWDLQNGVVTIPKSVRAERIFENARVFDFALSEEDMRRIDGMNQDRRFGPDPDNFGF